MSGYRPVIGLEIHVELNTKSKMFCQCPADHFGKPANTHVCPVCLGLPGALPVPNRKGIDWTVMVGMALNCTINRKTKFDRKNYFYPDLAKGYQISQYDEPIAVSGYVAIESDGNEKKFRIHRVHLEEDTGKLLHTGEQTAIDFNRCGVPLVEIVTEPDFDNSDDVKRFLEELQAIIRAIGVSEADMEKGSMRLEPNISLRKPGETGLPKYKVEVKNINSFRFVKQAIEYELKRQQAILEKGGLPKQETRGFDSKGNKTYSQRSKEEAHDYRYFPEPDIPPLEFDGKYLDAIKNRLPELPSVRLKRLVREYGIKPADAFVLTRSRRDADYFESVITESRKKLSGKVPGNLGQAIANLIVNRRISTGLAPSAFAAKAVESLAPKETDTGLLSAAAEKAIKANPQVVADYQKGKQNAIMFLVGQVMREMKGKADAKMVIEELKKRIGNK